VVTNQEFTPSALRLAGSSGVQLIGREKLETMLNQYNSSSIENYLDDLEGSSEAVVQQEDELSDPTPLAE
jgi:hypothetical protein